MPAYLVEEDGSTGDVEDLLQSAGTQSQPSPASQPDRLEGEDIPEKYRGKTAAELLAMAREQESYIGRLAQEKGELRSRVGTLESLVDKALKLRDPSTGREADSDFKDIDPYEFQKKPVEATNKLVKDALSPVQERLDELDLKARALDFERAYPTAVNDINDPDFIAFVSKSQRRQKLAQRAFGDTSRVDFDAAEELWESWVEFKEIKGATASGTQAANEPSSSQSPPKPKEPPPSLVTSGGSGAASGDSSGKPVYSASALQRLQNENPEKYWAPDIQAKIQEAYAEGRVKFP